MTDCPYKVNIILGYVSVFKYNKYTLNKIYFSKLQVVEKCVTSSKNDLINYIKENFAKEEIKTAKDFHGYWHRYEN